MSTQTKRLGFIEIFKSMFSSEPDIESNDDVVLPSELKETLNSINLKEAEVNKGFNNSSKPSNKGGFANKIDPQNAINRINDAKARQEAVKKIHEKISDKDEQERA